ncbi:DUF1249 domain-containing protein [Thiorhodococcus mannitoliphagus]|uniref:DUF1249 domain-containing protein n=2 Tax=Thiorhodococcus mannitoliphagus TaxID=329406 RepID=A0A6P1DSW8_9GAMM|nr:DUF1249 domain-containing protein [Thiorhodococcus mannitoliphagus]
MGALMALCEENFTLMQRLAPGLRLLSGSLTSTQRGVIDLHLNIEAQSPYTTQVRLTHLFGVNGERDPRPDPDARLRVYHDARQIEVLDLRQSVLRLSKDYAHPALLDKWQANLFLSKWLVFCLRQGHRFGVAACPTASSEADTLPPTCLARS